jgi:cell division protein FtsB
MRSVLTATIALILIHVAALLALLAWLYQDGRLDQDRANQVVALFSKTIAQEKQEAALAVQLEAETQEKARNIARLESVANGPITLEQRLSTQRARDEVAQARVDRLQREIKDLRRQLGVAQAQLVKEKQDLEAQRKAFEELRARETKLKADADFEQAVSMYEQLRPKQAKQMFQDLMKAGQTPQVVDYLAAMQLRKAAAVLKEFKATDEVAQVTMLVQMLRQRGFDPTVADSTVDKPVQENAG